MRGEARRFIFHLIITAVPDSEIQNVGKFNVGRRFKKKRKKEKGKKETMNKYHTLQLDTSVVEKNKEATRFGKAATHSTLWDPVPGQNLQQQGDSRSQKGWRGGKGGYVGDHKLPGGSWGHSSER